MKLKFYLKIMIGFILFIAIMNIVFGVNTYVPPISATPQTTSGLFNPTTIVNNTNIIMINITNNITNNITETYNITNEVYNNITNNLTFNVTNFFYAGWLTVVNNITNNITNDITQYITNNITNNFTAYITESYNITFNSNCSANFSANIFNITQIFNNSYYMTSTNAYIYTSESNMTFNETLLNSTINNLISTTIISGNLSYKYPTNYTFYSGSANGNMSENLLNISGFADGKTMTIIEASTTAYNITFNITNVTTIHKLITRLAYDGSGSHYAMIRLYNYNRSTWINLDMIIGSTPVGTLPDLYYLDNTYEIPTSFSNNFVYNNNVLVNIGHYGSGQSSHRLYIDYLGIEQ